MSLSSHLDNLREKPEHVRKRHAFMWAFGFTFIVFLFWLASFTGATGNVQNAVSSTVSKVAPPGASIIAAVGSFGRDIWSLIVEPKRVDYSVIQVRPGDK